MATSYPSSIQDLDATRGTANDTLSSPSHVTHHTNEDDTIEAIQNYLGTNATQTTPGAANRVLRSTSATATTWGALVLTSDVTGILPLANGGTNANLTASNGGIVYSTASAMAILAGTATAGQILRSGASAAPSWSTATYPATAGGAGTFLRSDGTNWLTSILTLPNAAAISTILYASAADTISALATANNGVLITSGTGVPSISSTLPTAVQDNITRLGTIVAGVWNGTTIAIANGGTGQTTATAAFNALSPSTTLGDIIYHDGTNDIRLAGNITTTRQFLRQTGTGTVSAAPAWDTLVAGDLPSHTHSAADITSGTLVIARGGTNSGTALNNNRIMVSSSGAIVEAAAMTNGQLLIGSTSAAPVVAALTAGTNIAITNGAGSITVGITGTIAIANGGTNSATALNNNRIMVSSSGAIVEASAMTNGQLLIGSTSAAPVVATLTAGSNITITNGAGSITIAASSGGAVKQIIITWPNDVARIIQDSGGSGAGAVSVEGFTCDTGTTSGSFNRNRVRSYQVNTQAFNRSPEYGAQLQIVAIPTTASSYFGIGAVSVAGTGHTYTGTHIGFKITVASSVASVYGTQADGTTETATAALTTVVAGDVVDVYLKVNGSTSVDYDYSVNGAAWSTSTNATANIPSVTSGVNTMMQGSVSNNSTAAQLEIRIGGGHYKR